VYAGMDAISTHVTIKLGCSAHISPINAALIQRGCVRMELRPMRLDAIAS
jgi:hypothetical protein